MSTIRFLEERDLPVVAGMMHRVLRKGRGEPPAALEGYMRSFYLEGPGCGDDLRSLVHVNDSDTVSGFLGVHVLPMIHGDRRLRGAIASSLMVEKGNHDPMAGARLMKAFVNGPQDLSFSETANRTSTQMWTRLRAVPMPQYSLDWVRIIRPSSFAIGMASKRIRLAGILKPVASAVDRFYRKRLPAGQVQWASTPAGGLSLPGMRVSEIDRDSFSKLLEPLTTHFALRPRWAEMPLDHMLQDAACKPDQGTLVLASVTAPNGAPVGAFAYYPQKGSMARVMQVLARQGQEGAVIDCLTDHAAARGVAALRGRSQPALMTAMLTRRIAFLPATNTIVHSRDPVLLEAMLGGQAFLNGLAGEEWSRLIGGRFD